MDNTYVYEALTWYEQDGTHKSDMIDAINDFGKVVCELPGFLHQALYQRDDGQWVDIYYWRSKEDADRSNQAVANEPSFHHLMSLIKADSLTLEVLTPAQEIGILKFER